MEKQNVKNELFTPLKQHTTVPIFCQTPAGVLCCHTVQSETSVPADTVSHPIIIKVSGGFVAICLLKKPAGGHRYLRLSSTPSPVQTRCLTCNAFTFYRYCFFFFFIHFSLLNPIPNCHKMINVQQTPFQWRYLYSFF